MVAISSWKGLKTTLLHVAAGFGSEFCLPYLLEQGAKITATDYDGRIPLHDSAQNGTLSIFKKLLEAGSNPEALDDYNNTPLHLASFAGNFLIVEYLLMLGVDIKIRTIDHKTAVDMAVEMRRYSVIDVFELFITSEPKYRDFSDEFHAALKNLEE